MKEIWKDIKNYEGLYQVSNLGSVRSLDKKIIVKLKFSNFAIKKGKLLKLETDTNGYLRIGLYKNGKIIKHRVHRLVAETFLNNLYNREQINHKNGNKKDNNINNLEWCTPSENIKHSFSLGLSKAQFKGKFGKEHNKSKPVIQYDLNNNFIKEWENAYCVTRQINIRRNQICMCCNGKGKTAGGYIWKYKTI